MPKYGYQYLLQLGRAVSPSRIYAGTCARGAFWAADRPWTPTRTA